VVKNKKLQKKRKIQAKAGNLHYLDTLALAEE